MTTRKTETHSRNSMRALLEAQREYLATLPILRFLPENPGEEVVEYEHVLVRRDTTNTKPPHLIP